MPDTKTGNVRESQRGAIEPCEVVTRWMRSDRSPDGVCCDGPHVFGYTCDGDEDPIDWVNRALRMAPEGARLRFTVEVVVHPTRLQVNPEPLSVVDVAHCVGCGKRAPWCSCGKADYQ